MKGFRRHLHVGSSWPSDHFPIGSGWSFGMTQPYQPYNPVGTQESSVGIGAEILVQDYEWLTGTSQRSQCPRLFQVDIVMTVAPAPSS